MSAYASHLKHSNTNQLWHQWSITTHTICILILNHYIMTTTVATSTLLQHYFYCTNTSTPTTASIYMHHLRHDNFCSGMIDIDEGNILSQTWLKEISCHWMALLSYTNYGQPNIFLDMKPFQLTWINESLLYLWFTEWEITVSVSWSDSFIRKVRG